MEKLIKGIHQFQTNIFSNHRKLFEKLASGQAPSALFITCSDSRIVPSLITQTIAGELFIMRNAGNIIPPYGAANGGEGATIEYAVTALGIRDIIVCGHSHCGAMHGLLNLEKLSNMPAVADWLKHAEATRRIILEKYPEDEKDLLLQTVKENVLVQLDNLRTHPSVAAQLAQGTLALHGWVYQIETGTIYSYSPELQKFTKITEYVPSPDALENSAQSITI